MVPVVMAYSHYQPLKACFIWAGRIEKKNGNHEQQIKEKQKPKSSAQPLELIWQEIYGDDGVSNMIRSKSAKTLRVPEVSQD